MSEVAATDAPQLDRTEARELTERLRQHLGAAEAIVKKAYFGRVWLALGYSSWETYCDGEGLGAIRLTRDERQPLSLSWSAAGMSTRAIAAVTGVHKDTVRNDISGGEKSPPQSSSEAEPPDTTEVVDAEIIEEEPEVPAITGRDGKTYPRPTNQSNGDHADDVRQLAALGLNATKIADDLGIPTAAVRTVANRHGIILPGSAEWVAQRWAKVAEMAAQGYTSRQIASAVGMTNVEGLRAKARERGIEITADAVIGRARHIDHQRFVEQVVLDLESTATTLDVIGDITADDIEVTQVDNWVTSIEQSIKRLHTFKNQLKEMTQ